MEQIIKLIKLNNEIISNDNYGKIELGTISNYYKGSFNLDYNDWIIFISSCSCLSIGKSQYIGGDKKIEFIINKETQGIFRQVNIYLQDQKKIQIGVIQITYN